MGRIQEFYPIYFSAYKIRYTQRQVEDITDTNRQSEIIAQEQRRAHRNAAENKIQISEKKFFPQLHKKVKEIAKACLTCKESKYDRHHPNSEI